MTEATTLSAPAVLVHGLDDALAAAEAAAVRGMALVLVSAPGAGGYAGGGWWRALVETVREASPGLAVTAVLDCGDEAGRVLAALRAGVTDVCFHGPEVVTARLRAIATQSGAALWTTLPSAFDPRGERDKVGAIAQWLDPD